MLIIFICIGKQLFVFAVIDFFLLQKSFVIIAISFATCLFVVAYIDFLYQTVVKISLVGRFVDVFVVRISSDCVYQAVLRSVKILGCAILFVVVRTYGMFCLLSFGVVLKCFLSYKGIGSSSALRIFHCGNSGYSSQVIVVVFGNRDYFVVGFHECFFTKVAVVVVFISRMAVFFAVNEVCAFHKVALVVKNELIVFYEGGSLIFYGSV